MALRPGPDGIGLETLFAEQPRDASGLDIQIRGVELTFDGEAGKGPFMRMPTSCAAGNSLARINSWDAPAAFSQLTDTLTPTGCDSLPFEPRAEGRSARRTSCSTATSRRSRRRCDSTPRAPPSTAPR